MHSRRKPYLYTLSVGLSFTPKSADLKGHDFDAPWLKIKDGTITLPPYYAWDGCSPKFSVFDLFIIGTPDGFIDHTGLPVTAQASAVHDALCQFRPHHNISKIEAVSIFNEMLGGFKPRPLYVLAVDALGPQKDWGNA